MAGTRESAFYSIFPDDSYEGQIEENTSLTGPKRSTRSTKGDHPTGCGKSYIHVLMAKPKSHEHHIVFYLPVVKIRLHWLGASIFKVITEVKEPWAWLVLGWMTILPVATNAWSAPAMFHCHFIGISKQGVSELPYLSRVGYVLSYLCNERTIKNTYRLS